MIKLVFVISILCSCCNNIKGDEEGLKVIPPNIAVEVGDTVKLDCKHYPENLAADTTLDWFMPNGVVPISELAVNQSVINMTQPDILRYKSANGTLTIVNATTKDAGTYKCKKGDTFEVESIVKVYEMPEYTIEIIVVLVINAVLVVIFITCAIWNFVKERRMAKSLIRRQKLGHKEIAIRALKD